VHSHAHRIVHVDCRLPHHTPRRLAELNIVIQRNGGDSTRLPTALTCFSRLLLPEYADEQKLRERVMLAIEHGKGFGLA
jgi:ubiquitin-protein ligase E3 A